MRRCISVHGDKKRCGVDVFLTSCLINNNKAFISLRDLFVLARDIPKFVEMGARIYAVSDYVDCTHLLY
jgi:hypothetical protein